MTESRRLVRAVLKPGKFIIFTASSPPVENDPQTFKLNDLAVVAAWADCMYVSNEEIVHMEVNIGEWRRWSSNYSEPCVHNDLKACGFCMLLCVSTNEILRIEKETTSREFARKDSGKSCLNHKGDDGQDGKTCRHHNDKLSCRSCILIRLVST